MSKRRANIGRRAPNICSTSWRPRNGLLRLAAAGPLLTAQPPNRSNGKRFQSFNRDECVTIVRRTSMPRNSNRGGRNNNPSGRNQYSDWGVMEMARERPVAAAAAAVGAAAAGLFLWSKRAQISNQLSSLSDQIGEWNSGSSD